MKFTSLAATAAFFHSVAAIPAYFVTVSCPDAVTITQTVYPPGWTATGPISYGGMGAGTSVYGGGSGGNNAGVTTSWTTNYVTTSTYCPTPGLYPPPPGLTNMLTAYMATTFTYSIPHPTGWVFNVNDYNCATCSKTVIVIVIISETMVEVMTEHWNVGASTTSLQMTGAPVSVYTYVPTTLTPPGGQGSGAPVVPAGASYTGRYPVIGSADYANPSLFRESSVSGFVIPTTRLPTAPFTRTQPPFSVPTSYTAGYPDLGSSDFANPSLFRESSVSDFTIPTTRLPTPAFTRTRPPFSVAVSYTAGYKSVSDYNIFQPSSVTGYIIPSATGSAPAPVRSSGAQNTVVAPTSVIPAGAPIVTTPAVAPSSTIPAGAPTVTTPAAVTGSRSYAGYGQGYPSVNFESAFTSVPQGISNIPSLGASTAAPTVVAPTATTTPPAAGTTPAVTPAVAPQRTGYGANYPSINFASAFTSVPTGFAFSVAAP